MPLLWVQGGPTHVLVSYLPFKQYDLCRYHKRCCSTANLSQTTRQESSVPNLQLCMIEHTPKKPFTSIYDLQMLPSLCSRHALHEMSVYKLQIFKKWTIGKAPVATSHQCLQPLPSSFLRLQCFRDSGQAFQTFGASDEPGVLSCEGMDGPEKHGVFETLTITAFQNYNYQSESGCGSKMLNIYRFYNIAKCSYLGCNLDSSVVPRQKDTAFLHVSDLLSCGSRSWHVTV